MGKRRVLLLALSGVRIYNSRLSELGMTLPGFVERGKVIASLPSLGLLTVAALCPPHWEPAYREFDDWTEAEVLEIAGEGWDIVAISSLTARVLEAYRIADLLREKGVTVVMGGLHVSALPEEALSHCRSVVVGEAEPVWAQLLSDFESGDLAPQYNGRFSKTPIGEVVPRYDLLDPSRYNRLTIQTTRGCPLDCSFCGASRLISHYKKKPLDAIDRELDAICSIWPEPFIELADDNTFVHKEWGRGMVDLLSRRKLKWFTESDISLADDENLLHRMASSGCAQVLIGLESSSQESLSLTDSKSWKSKRFDQYASAIGKIQDAGISVNGCFIIGFDSDGPEVFESTLRFADDLSLSEVQITLLTPFPGTQLERELRAQGRLLEDVFWEKCTLFDVTFHPKKMTAEELETGFHRLVADMYSDERTAKRKATLQSVLRHGKRRIQ